MKPGQYVNEAVQHVACVVDGREPCLVHASKGLEQDTKADMITLYD